jgi:hypothetical protein
VNNWANQLAARIDIYGNVGGVLGGGRGAHPRGAAGGTRGRGSTGGHQPGGHGPTNFPGPGRHFGGWTSGGLIQSDYGEMFIRRDHAASNARVLNRINAGMGHSDPAIQDLRRDVQQLHATLIRQQGEIEHMVSVGGRKTGTHGGDVMMDGYKVGRVLDQRHRRRVRE